MNLLLTIKEQDIVPQSPTIETKNFETRKAARAIVLDYNGQIALLSVNRYNYHKLPGGGVDKGERINETLKRELLEEIGCEINVFGEVGQVIEYRDQLKLKQTSYCFLARQIGKTKPPTFTKKEREDKFGVLWVNNIDGAIELLEKDKPQNYEGKFIQRRDLEFLKTAKKIV